MSSGPLPPTATTPSPSLPTGPSHAARRGVRAFAARRPLTAFLTAVFGIGWPLLAVPLLADHGAIGTGPLPVQFFALAVTVLVMVPAALWVTFLTDGRSGVRRLLARAVRWRFGAWWGFVLLGMPVTTLLLGRATGGSLDAGGLGATLARGLFSFLAALLVINLWEELVWAGFLQSRLEQRHDTVVSAILTAVPFTAIHIPLYLIGDVSFSSITRDLGLLLAMVVVLRLLVALVLHRTGGSVLAVGVLHAMFNESNNSGSLVDRLLDGADTHVLAPVALVVLTVAVAIVHRATSPAKAAVTR